MPSEPAARSCLGTYDARASSGRTPRSPHSTSFRCRAARTPVRTRTPALSSRSHHHRPIRPFPRRDVQGDPFVHPLVDPLQTSSASNPRRPPPTTHPARPRFRPPHPASGKVCRARPAPSPGLPRKRLAQELAHLRSSRWLQNPRFNVPYTKTLCDGVSHRRTSRRDGAARESDACRRDAGCACWGACGKYTSFRIVFQPRKASTWPTRRYVRASPALAACACAGRTRGEGARDGDSRQLIRRRPRAARPRQPRARQDTPRGARGQSRRRAGGASSSRTSPSTPLPASGRKPCA